jgi:vacuolar-type H+-ATPase subunit E/Vma4
LAGILQKPEVLSNGAKALEDYIDKIKEQKELSLGQSDLRQMAAKLRDKKGYGG